MPTQLGIDNLKKSVKFAIDFTEEGSKAMADGKFNFQDAFGFLDEVSEIPNVVKSWQTVKSEIGDLDDSEKKELHAFVVAEFDIPNDKVEVIIENALAWVLSSANLFSLLKQIRK